MKRERKARKITKTKENKRVEKREKKKRNQRKGVDSNVFFSAFDATCQSQTHICDDT